MNSLLKAESGTKPYTGEEIIKEVKATMELEGMPLNEREVGILRAYLERQFSGDEIRQRILNEVRKYDKGIIC